MKKILMCGSRTDVKGGIVSVIKNYLKYEGWDEYKIDFLPTHIETNKIKESFFFLRAYVLLIFWGLFRDYDIVYLHTAERGSFYRKSIIFWTMHFLRKKVVLHHHAAEFDDFYKNSCKIMQKYICKTLERVDLNIVLSERLISMIKSKAPNANVEVLYNAVDVRNKNPYNTKARNILFLGRLGERKGVYDLLQVISDLDSNLDEAIGFYLCGDGEIDRVNEKINEFGIKHRIKHVGWIDAKQKYEFFENTMINVLPSYNEGLPMTILETMAYGIPNISTNIASIPEVIISNENGILIQPGDLDALKEAIIYLTESTEVRYNMSFSAWSQIYSNFTIDSSVKILKEYLDRV